MVIKKSKCNNCSCISRLKDKLVERGVTQSNIYVVPHFDYKYLLQIEPSPQFEDNFKNGHVLLFRKIKPYKGNPLLLDAASMIKERIRREIQVINRW